MVEERATKADCFQKALEGRTIHTQDSNEPLNTRRKGGEFVYQCRVVDTTLGGIFIDVLVRTRAALL